MATDTDAIALLRGAIGTQRGPSSWREITQEQIDGFAEITGDHQWIHVDVERARRESPFGTTIAHGNLTLSSIDGFREQLSIHDQPDADLFALGVNMGWNRVRFPAPVPAGSRVRAAAELVSVEERGGGWWEIVDRFTVTVEGSDKPACVAESVVRLLLRDPGGS
jgi:acyl dehydratase